MSHNNKKQKPEALLRAALAANIRIARARLQLSQEALAHASGLSRVHIGSIERAEAACSLDVLAQIAFALDMPPSVLLIAPAGIDLPAAQERR